MGTGCMKFHPTNLTYSNGLVELYLKKKKKGLGGGGREREKKEKRKKKSHRLLK